MSEVLVIGEKTSQVKRFVETICGTYQSKKQAKYIYTYTGQGTISGTTYQLTFFPLAGHISNIDTTKEYSWGKCAPIKIVHDQAALEIKHQRKYVTLLRKEIKNKRQIWLATDPDSEGDNIAWEVLQVLASIIKREGIEIKRIWNSSLTTKEIWRAFIQPRSWNNNLALAVLGRRFVDAWLGFAGTREVTRAARQVATVKVLSVGRVQLPTLYLIVSADLAHETFVSVDQWALAARLKHKGVEFEIIHVAGYVTDEELVRNLLNQLSGAKYAIVSQISREVETQLPPHPLNTTSAVSLLSKTMKIQASKALELMVDLYNKGLLSYPRTENKKFKTGFPHKDILSSLLKISDYVPYISSIKNTTQVRNNGPRKGEEEDHDPIHPTGEVKGISSLKAQQAKALDILTRYYISLFLQDLEIEKTDAAFLIEGEEFGTRGRRILNLGWRTICWWTNTKQKELPELIRGESIAIQELYLKSNQTKPPKQYTDAEILLAMERANIGTKSSRPDILKKIQQRNYVRRQGQTLVSTLWGRTLIASLTPIWPEIVSPEFTAYVEELMDKVAKGSETFAVMFNQLRLKYLELHQKLIEKIPEYQELLKQVKLSDQKERGIDQIQEINSMLVQLKI